MGKKRNAWGLPHPTQSRTKVPNEIKLLDVYSKQFPAPPQGKGSESWNSPKYLKLSSKNIRVDAPPFLVEKILSLFTNEIEKALAIDLINFATYYQQWDNVKAKLKPGFSKTSITNMWNLFSKRRPNVTVKAFDTVCRKLFVGKVFFKTTSDKVTASPFFFYEGDRDAFMEKRKQQEKPKVDLESQSDAYKQVIKKQIRYPTEAGFEYQNYDGLQIELDKFDALLITSKKEFDDQTNVQPGDRFVTFAYKNSPENICGPVKIGKLLRAATRCLTDEECRLIHTVNVDHANNNRELYGFEIETIVIEYCFDTFLIEHGILPEGSAHYEILREGRLQDVAISRETIDPKKTLCSAAQFKTTMNFNGKGRWSMNCKFSKILKYMKTKNPLWLFPTFNLKCSVFWFIFDDVDGKNVKELEEICKSEGDGYYRPTPIPQMKGVGVKHPRAYAFLKRFMHIVKDVDSMNKFRKNYFYCEKNSPKQTIEWWNTHESQIPSESMHYEHAASKALCDSLLKQPVTIEYRNFEQVDMFMLDETKTKMVGIQCKTIGNGTTFTMRKYSPPGKLPYNRNNVDAFVLHMPKSRDKADKRFSSNWPTVRVMATRGIYININKHHFCFREYKDPVPWVEFDLESQSVELCEYLFKCASLPKLSDEEILNDQKVAIEERKAFAASKLLIGLKRSIQEVCESKEDEKKDAEDEKEEEEEDEDEEEEEYFDEEDDDFYQKENEEDWGGEIGIGFYESRVDSD